jgi:hypothetical protein
MNRNGWPGERAPRATPAPYVVIDAGGDEVGVVVEYGQYVRLLRLVAGQVGRRALSPYWRRALDGCFALDGDWELPAPETGTLAPGRRSGRPRRASYEGS